MMLTHMLLHNLTPHTACNMQNGAAVNVARSTLRRWWKHFEWWGETPVATACRFNYKPMVGSKAMTALEKVALDHIAAAHPAYYLDEMQDALERECERRIHVSQHAAPRAGQPAGPGRAGILAQGADRLGRPGRPVRARHLPRLLGECHSIERILSFAQPNDRREAQPPPFLGHAQHARGLDGLLKCAEVFGHTECAQFKDTRFA
jgi:hypothetical protein